MSDLLDIHDVVHLGTSAVVVLVLWFRMGDVIKRQDTHEEKDDERFAQITSRIDGLMDGR